MITDLGKLHIKRYMARQVGSIGGAIACGVGETAESSNDTNLEFEVFRADVHLTTFDFTTDRLIFKATLPVGFSGNIYEVGLWSLSTDASAGNFSSKLLAIFDDSEQWSGTFGGASGSRLGSESLLLSAGPSATTTDTRDQFAIDLSGYSNSDSFKLAFETTTQYTSSVFVRFMNDATNYYQFSTSPGAVPGYHIISWDKGSAAITGTPSWSNINSIVVGTTATAGGSSQIYLDALRVEDKDPFNSEYSMVAREVLPTPIQKIASKTLDIEFGLAVNI